MKKLFLISFIVFVLFGFLVFNRNLQAKIYVDIDSPAFKLIPIAICDFSNTDTGSLKAADGDRNIPENVKKDLSLTGIFNILKKESFLDRPDSLAATEAETINFPNWSAIGADYLLRGTVSAKDNEIIVDIYLFDVVRGERIFHKKYRAGNNNLKAVSRAIASDIMLALINDEGDFNSMIAFISQKSSKSDIQIINYDGSELKRITNHQSIIMSPRWSPDGQLLAFTSFKDGRPAIYIRNLRSGLERKVASFDGLNLCGAFSPDGKKLLLTLSKDGNEEIYVMDTDTLKLRRLTNNYSIDVSPSWSPNGQKIIFVSNRSGSPQIYVMDEDGGNVKRVTYEGSYNTSPSWSPRGDRIVYEGLINKRYQIFSIDEEGNSPVQLTFDSANNESPSWSPSGRQIVYVSRGNSKHKLMIVNSNGSNPRVLYEQNNKLMMSAWSPRFK
jgi:TolB protein